MLQKSSFLILGLILIGLCIPVSFSAAEPVSDGDVVDIPIRPQDGEPIGIPRSPDATQIVAWYSWESCSVSATLSNAGEYAEVEFNNLLTEEYYCYEIPGTGLSVMPIGNSSGCWTVIITLSSGAIYEGMFIL